MRRVRVAGLRSTTLNSWGPMNRRVVVPILVLVLAIPFLAGPRALRLVGCLPKTQIALRQAYQGPPTTMGSPVEDWPKWRGSRGDQISREVLADQWPAGGPRTLWAADV